MNCWLYMLDLLNRWCRSTKERSYFVLVDSYPEEQLDRASFIYSFFFKQCEFESVITKALIFYSIKLIIYIYIYIIYNYIRGLVVQWLGNWPLVQMVRRSISNRPACSEINFSEFTYGAIGSLVLSWSWARQRGFISFRCLWIQLRITLSKGYVRTICPSSPSYPSFRSR